MRADASDSSCQCSGACARRRSDWIRCGWSTRQARPCVTMSSPPGAVSGAAVAATTWSGRTALGLDATDAGSGLAARWSRSTARTPELSSLAARRLQGHRVPTPRYLSRRRPTLPDSRPRRLRHRHRIPAAGRAHRPHPAGGRVRQPHVGLRPGHAADRRGQRPDRSGLGPGAPGRAQRAGRKRQRPPFRPLGHARPPHAAEERLRAPPRRPRSADDGLRRADRRRATRRS